MMKRLMVLLMLMAMVGIAKAELMPDGGFESGMWSGSGAFVYNTTYLWGYGTAAQGIAGPYAGAYSGVFTLPASGFAYTWYYGSAGWVSFAGGSGWAAAWQQGLAVSDGDVVQASAYIKELTGTPGAAGIMKIEYYDSGDNKISEDIESFVATGSWTQITGSLFTAPALTDHATMVVGHETGNGGIIGASVAFDNVSLVPEPVTISLLGLGAFFLRRRRA